VREFAHGQCAEILALLKRYGPMSPEQIAAHMDIDSYSVRKRLSDLQHASKAAPNGMTCSTVSGRRQRIWMAV
jgi:predicted ArsR family transcriptional regulator